MAKRLKDFLSSKKKHLLKEFLDLAENKDSVFTLPALEGFLFGIAITPSKIMINEWMPVIFDGPLPSFENKKQAELLISNLFDSYNSYLSAFYNDKLSFPFDIENPTKEFLDELTDWSAGFLEALLLRPEIWHMGGKKMYEEYTEEINRIQTAFIVVYSFVDPETTKDFIIKALEEIEDEEDFYLSIYHSLPNAVETLKNYGLELAKNSSMDQYPPFL